MKAEKAAAKERVFVSIDAVSPIKAQAPTGKGLSTSPATVDRKIASNCHACCVTSTGFGTKNRTARPIPTDITKGTSFAPEGASFVNCGLGSGGGGGGAEDEAWSGGNGELMRRRREGRVMEWRDMRWRREVEADAEM